MPESTDLNAKRAEFEQELASLKEKLASGYITPREFYDQGAKLHFDDPTSGQTWWLDPEKGIWYVGSIKDGDFKPYQPETVPSEPKPEPSLPPPPEVKSPAPQPLPEPPAPLPSPQPEPPPQPLPKPTGSKPQKKIIFITISGVFMIFILCGIISWGYSLFKNNTPSAPTRMQIVEETNTSTLHSIHTPTSTLPPQKPASPPPSPSDTPTAVPSPTDSPVPPTDPPIPTLTSTPFPTPTPRPLPSPTT
ncbi:MAG: hypothetical protein D6706_15915, partial [Chloroflexi bacterium]